MTRSGDNIVLYMLLAMFLFFLCRQWFNKPIQQWKQRKEKKVTSIGGEVPLLLQQHGYDVVDARQKVPLTFEIDDREYESRMFVDYIAEAEGESYLVVVARDRKPLRWNGPGIRDFFLPLFLLYQPDGILYVNKEKAQIKKITMDPMSEYVLKKEKSGWFLFVIFGMVIGLLLAWLLR